MTPNFSATCLYVTAGLDSKSASASALRLRLRFNCARNLFSPAMRSLLRMSVCRDDRKDNDRGEADDSEQHQ